MGCKILLLAMKKYFLLFIVSLGLFSCSIFKENTTTVAYSSVKIDTLLTDKISCRALLIDKDVVWYAGTGGKYGSISLVNKKHNPVVISKEKLKLEFRSIAQTKTAVFILSVANPALLYKIDKKTNTSTLVYEEVHESVFYDSMLFVDDSIGIAIGDPINGYPSIIKTTDGGTTWKKVGTQALPKFEEGEAFFAASNTNIMYRNGLLFMVSGGKKSRFFVSKDYGESWTVSETPIVQGSSMTGTFTADFYDDKVGIIAGGNYEKLDQNFQNKAITTDGGSTWNLVADNSGFGYASCVQFVPKSRGKAIVEMGANGVFYSMDSGNSWKKIAEDKDFIAFRFIDSKTIIASGKNRIVRMQLQ